MSESPFRPSDADVLDYLSGKHGPPSPEVVQIIQDELERAALPTPDRGSEASE